MKQFQLITLLLIISILMHAQNNTYSFLIGTYTQNTTAKGIYSLKMNGNVAPKTQLLAELENPSFISFSSDKKFVYAINQNENKSAVSAYRFVDDKLVFLNRVCFDTNVGSCHVSVSQQHVMVANYGAGSVFVVGLNKDGSLTELVQKVQHSGSSIQLDRQEKAHAHQAVFSPDYKFLLVNDLGVDKVYVYKYDHLNTSTPLTLSQEFSVKPGSGPRHLTFNKSGKIAYLLQELDGTVSVLCFKKGQLSLVSSSTVVRKSDIKTVAADIHLSSDEKFLYATNRGTANDITCFKVARNGVLTFVQQVSVEGNGPRNFAISADGKLALVGNQYTHTVTVFNRNTKTGMLNFSNLKVDLGSPVCILEY
ncbi:MAG: lactonase family protein [Paludibacter sp.]|nr:lactonase family protein [Paludibacter sp.]